MKRERNEPTQGDINESQSEVAKGNVWTWVIIALVAILFFGCN